MQDRFKELTEWMYAPFIYAPFIFKRINAVNCEAACSGVAIYRSSEKAWYLDQHQRTEL